MTGEPLYRSEKITIEYARRMGGAYSMVVGERGYTFNLSAGCLKNVSPTDDLETILEKLNAFSPGIKSIMGICRNEISKEELHEAILEAKKKEAEMRKQ